MITKVSEVYKNNWMYRYDKLNNPDSLNVWQLSADGFRWIDGNGRPIEFLVPEKVIFLLQAESQTFAVVEISLHPTRGNAYFVNEAGSKIETAKIPADQHNLPFIAYDVYESEGRTCILFADQSERSLDLAVYYDQNSFEIVESHKTK